jgi:hypothetical protein
VDSESVADFSFFADTNAVQISQWPDRVRIDDVAMSLLALGIELTKALRPGYGWVDESGWNLPEVRALAAERPQYLFWANFFGPDHVHSVGRAFLKGAPAWRTTDLDDGGVLIVSTESFEMWRQDGQTELLTYLRSRFPKIAAFRATPIPL